MYVVKGRACNCRSAPKGTKRGGLALNLGSRCLSCRCQQYDILFRYSRNVCSFIPHPRQKPYQLFELLLETHNPTEADKVRPCLPVYPSCGTAVVSRYGTVCRRFHLCRSDYYNRVSIGELSLVISGRAKPS